MIFTKKKKLRLIIKALSAAGVPPTVFDLALIIAHEKTLEELYRSAVSYYWKIGNPLS